MFQLAGDELYVDAHVLKWKPLANLLGLHTDYELARIAGRYADVDSERTGERTVYALGTPKPVDLFTLRRRFPLLRVITSYSIHYTKLYDFLALCIGWGLATDALARRGASP